jgi:hypothetical protein
MENSKILIVGLWILRVVSVAVTPFVSGPVREPFILAHDYKLFVEGHAARLEVLHCLPRTGTSQRVRVSAKWYGSGGPANAPS